MIELIGIVLVVQGVGGFINRVGESKSYSWFVQLHVLPPSFHIAASIAMAVLGAALVLTDMARKRKNKA
ncbi:hypothetical protein SAMN05421504_105140 [Amycolatopsis xylanica]|uniref:Uncharacterized protein n=1 Tax=Amycolatopsis xylanica TaxID=589385 RepID=A0A1H3IVW4_9PSEU|nr:hypothetical protein [Amycolatopsis xylanica]SDY31841.1 hypothetical protein SAMN05421504_105140 [Amycolatopsis xylanica]